MSEPQELGTTIETAMAEVPPQSKRRAVLDAMDAQHRRNQLRRQAVLSHEDLRRRLQQELGYTHADNWNGYVPPATVNEFCTDELGRSPHGRLNQRGKYGIGEQPNDSRQRAILLELSRIARERQQTF